MNKTQLKKLSAAESTVQELIANLEGVKGELEDSFDNKSEGWQEGEKGQEAQEEIDSVGEIIDSLENIDWPAQD